MIIPSLGIEWDVEHKKFACTLLAQMKKGSEVAEEMLREYQGQWRIRIQNPDGTPNKEELSRAILIREWLHQRISYLAKGKTAGYWQRYIRTKRVEWLHRVQDFVPLANKSARIEMYARIAKAAEKEKMYQAATRAGATIALELGELKLPEKKDVDAPVRLRDFDPKKCTDDELERLARGEHPLLVLPQLREYAAK